MTDRPPGPLGVGLILLALVLSACSGPRPLPTPVESRPTVTPEPIPTTAPPAPVAPPTPSTASAPAPVPTPAPMPGRRTTTGGTLTYALGFEPSSLSPITGTGSHTHLILRHLYDTLVFLDGGGVLRPGLARSWQLSPDGLTYTLSLRDGVTFHDGTPFNAHAVKFTFDTIVNPDSRSLTARELLGPYYVATDAADPFTVQVSFSQPYAPFLGALANAWLAPISPAAYQRAGPDYARSQVGTGPFKWREHVPKDRVVLVRNDAYNWAPDGAAFQGPPSLDAIVFKFVPEPTVRSAHIQSGEAHLAHDLMPRDVAQLKDRPGYTLLQAQVPGIVTSLFLNTRRAPTDSLEVRQAINYALNRDDLTLATFSGLTRTAHTILAPPTFGFAEETRMYHPNLERARALLDQAGWLPGADGVREKDGDRAELIMYTFATNRYPEILRIIQAQLREVGLASRISVVNFAQMREAIKNDAYNAIPNVIPSADPYVLSLAFHSRNIEHGVAYSRYADEELDSLLDQALGEHDPSSRSHLYARAQTIIMERALVAPLFPLTTNTLARSEVKGLTTDYATGEPLLTGAYLEKR